MVLKFKLSACANSGYSPVLTPYGPGNEAISCQLRATLNEVATHSFSNLGCYDGHLSMLQLVSRHVFENSGDR